MNRPSLKGKTVFITGASRGIGRAIALRAARDGAHVVIAAKTAAPHPRLPGTIHTVAGEVEAAGGEALAVEVDVRHEEQVDRAVDAAVERFGGIDVLVNNAGAIRLTGTADTPIRRFDLLIDVNLRATFLCTQRCLPHLRRSTNPHVLVLAPPIDLAARWLAPHLAYTISKYGMSMCTLGLAAELAAFGIAANSLWPKTMIGTAAVENLLGGTQVLAQCRQPSIVADAAHVILTQPSRAFTGRFCIDEDVLREAGVSDFSRYAVDPAQAPALDIFVEL